MAIVTNGFDKVQSRRVKESGIAAFMEEVFVSERSDSEKPNRKIFDTALRTLGVENREHVLVVGDSLSSDIQGGINAGLDTCWLNRGHLENPARSARPMRSTPSSSSIPLSWNRTSWPAWA